MKLLRLLALSAVLACAASSADETPAPETPPAFEEYSVTVEGLGEVTVIAPEGEPGYRVRLADGRVTAFPAQSGAPSQANAAADIEHAIANPPPPPVPPKVSRRQLLLALLAGHNITRAQIRTALQAIPDATQREAALIEFDEATEFERGHALVAQLAAVFSLSSTQVDAVFRTAGTL